MRAANDGLGFSLELGALASFAYWGWSEGGLVTRWVLVIGAPVLVATVWGRFLAPKSSARVRDPWRLVLEMVVFGGASGALAWAGAAMWAIVFGALAALHLVLTFAFRQRSTLSHWER